MTDLPPSKAKIAFENIPIPIFVNRLDQLCSKIVSLLPIDLCYYLSPRNINCIMTTYLPNTSSRLITYLPTYLPRYSLRSANPICDLKFSLHFTSLHSSTNKQINKYKLSIFPNPQSHAMYSPFIHSFLPHNPSIISPPSTPPLPTIHPKHPYTPHYTPQPNTRTRIHQK